MSIRRDNRNKSNYTLITNLALTITKDDASIMKRCALVIAFAIVNKMFIANDSFVALTIVDETSIATTIMILRSIKRNFFYTRFF